MTNQNRTIYIWIAIAVGVLIAINLMGSPFSLTQTQTWDNADFETAVQNNQIAEAKVVGTAFSGTFDVTLNNGSRARFHTTDPNRFQLLLDEANIAYTASAPSSGTGWFNILYLILMVAFIGYIIYSFRSAQGGGRGGFGMGFG